MQQQIRKKERLSALRAQQIVELLQDQWNYLEIVGICNVSCNAAWAYEEGTLAGSQVQLLHTKTV